MPPPNGSCPASGAATTGSVPSVYAYAAFAAAAAAQTSTTEAPRVVGDPLPPLVVVAIGLAVLAAILVAGFLAGRRRH